MEYTKDLLYVSLQAENGRDLYRVEVFTAAEQPSHKARLMLTVEQVMFSHRAVTWQAPKQDGASGECELRRH